MADTPSPNSPLSDTDLENWRALAEPNRNEPPPFGTPGWNVVWRMATELQHHRSRVLQTGGDMRELAREWLRSRHLRTALASEDEQSLTALLDSIASSARLEQRELDAKIAEEMHAPPLPPNTDDGTRKTVNFFCALTGEEIAAAIRNPSD